MDANLAIEKQKKPSKKFGRFKYWFLA